MKKITQHLGGIIAALAAVAMLIGVLALSSNPVSDFFSDLISTTTDKADNMLDGLGTHVSRVVPEGGEYTTVDGKVYGPGEMMPLARTGDTYTDDGDYIYMYNYFNKYSSSTYVWTVNPDQKGWGVTVKDKNKSEYGQILTSINSANITSIAYTFHGCASLVTAPAIPNTVQNMWNTFYGCTSLTNAPTITSSVTNMTSTFQGCTALKIAPDMSNATSVQTFERAFYKCSALTTVSSFPSNVEDMTNAFYNCKKLTNVPVSFPTSVTKLNGVFLNCLLLKTAPDMTNCTNLSSITSAFSGCKALKTYTNSTAADGDFSNYILPNSITTLNSTFKNCVLLTHAPVLPSSVENLSSTFSGCTALQVAPTTIPESVTSMNTTFGNCKTLSTVPAIPKNVTDMTKTFYLCEALTGEVEINANPETYTECFYLTIEPITLTGTSTAETKAALAATGTRGNVQ